jgi:hypothetical protein
MRSRSLVQTALLLIPFALACGDAPSGEWAGSVTDSSGVRIVDNPEAGLWSGAGPWSFAEELRIGGLDAPETSQFGMVVGLDIDGAGQVYVLDMQASEVRAFDGSGAWVRSFGRPGGGPGELSRQLTGVFVLGGEVWVADLGNQRITRWGLDGSERPAIPLDLAQGIPLRWERLGDDRVVAQFRSILGVGMQGDTTGDPIVTVGSPDPDTLAVLPQGTSISVQGGAARFRFFDREPLWNAAADGALLTASNDVYRIEVRDAEGRLTRIVHRAFEPRPVTDSDTRRMLSAIRELMMQQGAPPAAVDQLLQGASFADHFPVMAQILAGPDGTLWVQRIRTPDQIADTGELNLQDMGADEWDVFDGEGRYLGMLTLPTKFAPMRVEGDALWGVQRDELDVPSIVRYRLVRD